MRSFRRYPRCLRGTNSSPEKCKNLAPDYCADPGRGLCRADLSWFDASWSQFPRFHSNLSQPSRDTFSSQGLPSISPLLLSSSSSRWFTLPRSVFLSLIFQSWQMKRIKSRGGGGRTMREEEEGGEEQDTRLIRLEIHAGLNILLMSTTKDSSRVSGAWWGKLCMI